MPKNRVMGGEVHLSELWSLVRFQGRCLLNRDFWRFRISKSGCKRPFLIGGVALCLHRSGQTPIVAYYRGGWHCPSDSELKMEPGPCDAGGRQLSGNC